MTEERIVTKHGDLTAVSSGIIVHQCNAKGVMGSGVAKCIREKFPEAFMVYRRQFLEHARKCDKVPLGSITHCNVAPALYVVNLIGQDAYRGFSNDYTEKRWTSYDAIEDGIININDAWLRGDLGNVPMIHIPLIGSGLGGGNWNIIKAIIEENAHKDLGVTLWIK